MPLKWSWEADVDTCHSVITSLNRFHTKSAVHIMYWYQTFMFVEMVLRCKCVCEKLFWYFSESSVCTVAVCAGSGASVLNGVKADLYVTGKHTWYFFCFTVDLFAWHCYYCRCNYYIHCSGEMSHHEVLDAVAKGSSVILSDHSNSERGFLAVFRERLAVRLPDSVTVAVSKADRDPLEVVWPTPSYSCTS